MTERDADRRVLAALRRRGLLLLQDAALPSAVATIVGEPIRGSWWAHPRSHEIFRALSRVEDDRDVLVCKLVGGKVTFVHRSLFPALLAVATCGEAWQTAGLDHAAARLLERIRRGGRIAASGPAVKELERRLLAHAEEQHSETGAHVMTAETWDEWASRAGVASEISPEEGRRRLERAAARLGAAEDLLPWRRPEPRRQKPRGGIRSSS